MAVLVLTPKTRSIGSLSVRRTLPARERRMVGPFIFFDHMGPVVIAAGVDSDVRPHPHIGLATVTALFDGALVHRDSLGSEQVIRPGDVNWMTAGRGIVHSERALPDEKTRAHSLHGLQLWAALPLADEECAPDFQHHEAKTLPSFEEPGIRARVLAGAAFDLVSPVRTRSPLFYVDVRMTAGSALDLGRIAHAERAVYVVDGAATVGAARVDEAHMAVLDGALEGDGAVLRAESDVHAVLLGGAPLDGPMRHAYWNFVSSSKDRIEQAKRDWRARRFASIPGDDVEFVPLPEE